MYEMHERVSQDSSVGRVTSTQTGLQFLAGTRNFSPPISVQSGCGAVTPSPHVSTRGLFT